MKSLMKTAELVVARTVGIFHVRNFVCLHADFSLAM